MSVVFRISVGFWHVRWTVLMLRCVVQAVSRLSLRNLGFVEAHLRGAEMGVSASVASIRTWAGKSGPRSSACALWPLSPMSMLYCDDSFVCVNSSLGPNNRWPFKYPFEPCSLPCYRRQRCLYLQTSCTRTSPRSSTLSCSKLKRLDVSSFLVSPRGRQRPLGLSGDDNTIKGGPSNGSCRAGARENCGENVPSCIQVTSERRAAECLKCMVCLFKAASHSAVTHCSSGTAGLSCSGHVALLRRRPACLFGTWHSNPGRTVLLRCVK